MIAILNNNFDKMIIIVFELFESKKNKYRFSWIAKEELQTIHSMRGFFGQSIMIKFAYNLVRTDWRYINTVANLFIFMTIDGNIQALTT